jgi:multidrug efflux pump subunit AcrA (membrane-fusion protein)
VPRISGSHVWVSEAEGIRPVVVRIGVSNDGKTEIIGGDLQEGEKVIVADAAGGSSFPRELVHTITAWITHAGATALSTD